jgi:acetyl-CoA carboxylase biotin carboxyl carrier protein
VTLTAKDVAEITRLLEESDFLELRIEHEGLKLTLKRGSPESAAVIDSTPGEAAAAAASARWSGATSPPAPSVAPPAPHEPPRAKPPASAGDAALIEVTAPLLGIFYRAPRPGAAPYVEVGSEIREETIVGIIEVMKLMNGVRAEACGRVVEILAEDGAAVESGQVLLRLARGKAGG